MRLVLHSLLIFLLFTLECFAQKDLRFTHITPNKGLSQSTVQCILKDSKGFMWFGTRDGLNKYDGYTFTVFKHDPSDEGSISNNIINDIIEDSKHNVWVATRSGLNKFDREKNRFIRYTHGSNKWLWVSAIAEDHNNKIWLGTRDGLLEFNPTNAQYKVYMFEPGNPNSLIHNGVNKITVDINGDILCCTVGGLDRYNPKTKTFKHYKQDSIYGKGGYLDYINVCYLDKNGNLWIGTNDGALRLLDRKTDSFIDLSDLLVASNLSGRRVILCFNEGLNGQLWMGTENDGLLVYDYNSKKFTSYKNDQNDEYSLGNNAVRNIYKDNNENMWVGTYAGGVDFCPKFGAKFTHYKTTSTVGKSLNNNIVKSILEDVDGGLWIGTDGGGINYFDRKTGTFNFYTKNEENPNSVGSNNNHCMIEVNKDTLAFGYHRGGFDLFNRKTKKFTNFFPDPSNPNSFPDITVSTLYKDKKGNLWIGTWASGISFWDLKSNKFKLYQNNGNPNSLRTNLIYSIKEDKEGNIWVATEMGVELYDKKIDGFKHYLCDTARNERVYTIHIDKKNNLWIGTLGGGLNLLDKKTGIFTKYKEEDGLPNNIVNGILEDAKGNLWLSTNKGISRFNPETKTFRNYGIEDGVQSNEFKRNSCFKNKAGEMFFGGVNGLNIFFPDSIKDNSFLPPIVFTGFQIFNKPVEIGAKDSILSKDISETQEIKLSYKQSVFTFQFAALNFTLPEKNQYAYMLKGFDKDWNYAGTERKATYTNIDPGEYTFMVKASNNDGVWNEEGSSIKLIITPPFWETWWFRTLIIASVLGSAFTWYRARMNTIKRQQELLEKQVRERTEELRIANGGLQEQKEELQAQAANLQNANNEINELYSEIKDSIRAAQVIQKSILPSPNIIKKHLPESFILYKPKDVVSGDFYWYDVIDEQIIIAAVDCTGHGVSGAFMSINGHHLINQSIYPYKNIVASDILNRLNKGVIKALSQNEEEGEILDGMDIALCIVDKDKKSLQYAGANNPLYINRNGQIIQVKASRFAIGNSVTKKIQTFTNNQVALQTGDIIYIFSDGYADQLREDGKEKFMYPRFRELLLSISEKDMESQMRILDENLMNWRGSMEQIDDILVIGFRV